MIELGLRDQTFAVVSSMLGYNSKWIRVQRIVFLIFKVSTAVYKGPFQDNPYNVPIDSQQTTFAASRALLVGNMCRVDRIYIYIYMYICGRLCLSIYMCTNIGMCVHIV